jgi:hypothetical protein
MAIWDVWRKGREAKRWREYLFLITTVVLAMGYGAINDQVTVGISWEYFYYGKGVGQSKDPAEVAMRWEAAKVGMKATWTAGLIVGVGILLANNPWKKAPRLGYGELYRMMGWVVVFPVVCAIVLGWVGYEGWLVKVWPALDAIKDAPLLRPQRFMCVAGIHLGGYVGGAIGMLVGMGWVVSKRVKK